MDRLKAADPRRAVFGAAKSGKFGHDYVVNRVIPEADLFGFERRHGFTLPAEFRAFLLRIGNGKMGPSYGMDPLDVARDVPSLRTPFPLTAERAAELTAAVAEANRTQNWGQMPAVDYDELANGTLFLVEHGCGAASELVVNGELRGQVWGTGDWVAPETDRHGRPHTFLTWYEAWLDQWLSPGAIEKWASSVRR